MGQVFSTIDANEAVARIAYLCTEVAAIYPITPSSSIGEWVDQWSTEGRLNLFGAIPSVVEMQSEGGVAGAIHGAIQGGALATTFTASQGLLLMLPNLYKIAGELSPCVIHVAARTLATHALSIFGDHSDVMAARQAGWVMLCASSVQEAQDFALISHAATLEARLPFMHFFDGFRTSHEVAKVELISEDVVRALIDPELVAAHRDRAMSPDRPLLRGTAQNPDVFFQSREACSPFYRAVPEIVEHMMDRFARLTGRRYHLFDYVGDPEAERVMVIMGSGGEVAEETAEVLNSEGGRVGVLKVRLYRPFDRDRFVGALPETVKSIVVMDRTKEPGAVGEPLYQDVTTALMEAYSNGSLRIPLPKIIGGRFGLSSKDFTPAMVKACFDELLKTSPKNHFTVGIVDDISHSSLPWDANFCTEAPETVRAIFYGLGADGTVGANKNSIKIIGEETPNFAQGYFVYDSKKSGSMTISHLRFGPRRIRSSYLVSDANFIACHQFQFLDRIDMLAQAKRGSTFLLNSPYGPEEVWDHLPANVQRSLLEKEIRFFVIDAVKVAESVGMKRRINTVMQACFFAISNVLPREEALAQIKKAIKKSYGKMGEAIVAKNVAAVDAALGELHEVAIAGRAVNGHPMVRLVSGAMPPYVRDVASVILAGRGDDLPVSALPPDGTFPTGTTKYEKRNIATAVPVWDTDLCIQCGKCVLVCPHAAIRGKLYEESCLAAAPETFKAAASRFPEHKEMKYSLQVSVEDCTGCTLCVEVCPAKDRQEPTRRALEMKPQLPLREQEMANWDFFLSLPQFSRSEVDGSRVKELQLLEPLFEFSGACSGCGETPYLKAITQLFGDRMLVANATGCSSIYGGNLPTTPWTCNEEGRGPAWNNSLFEDNAEFGYGIRVALDHQAHHAAELLRQLVPVMGEKAIEEVLHAPQESDGEIAAQRERVARLKERLAGSSHPAAKELAAIAQALVRKSLWIVGGDGWAYDIDYGGLDHVIASGKNVNILVLDTEVYSNTGGQASKSTPRGAVAKFASGGKPAGKKDLALLAMSYGNVYVARVAMGANDAHFLKVLREAEAFNGPSLIIAYSHCIAHGFDLSHGLDQQKNAVLSGHWPLLRYNPALKAKGQNPFQLDSKPAKLALADYVYNEARYKMLKTSKPTAADALLAEHAHDIEERWRLYETLAAQVPAAIPPTC